MTWGSRLLAGALVLAVGLPARSPAQQRPDGEWRVVASPIAGWHFFGPVRASVSAVVGFSDGDLQIPAAHGQSILLIAEPGWRGGRLSLAYTKWFAVKGGLIWRATALRFWGGNNDRTYYGGEVQWIISILPLGVRVGAFRPSRETPDGRRRTLWLADLSVMY